MFAIINFNFKCYYCKSVQVFTQIFSTAAINKKGKTWIYDGKHANNRIEKLNRLILLWFYCIFFCHKMQVKFCFLSFYQNITFRFDKKSLLLPFLTCCGLFCFHIRKTASIFSCGKYISPINREFRISRKADGLTVPRGMERCCFNTEAFRYVFCLTGKSRAGHTVRRTVLKNLNGSQRAWHLANKFSNHRRKRH